MTMARAIVARTGTLTDTNITTIQQVVRAALANRYIVVRFDGLRADADKGREDEYLFDARGRVRFHRYSQEDPVRPDSGSGACPSSPTIRQSAARTVSCTRSAAPA